VAGTEVSAGVVEELVGSLTHGLGEIVAGSRVLDAQPPGFGRTVQRMGRAAARSDPRCRSGNCCPARRDQATLSRRQRAAISRESQTGSPQVVRGSRPGEACNATESSPCPAATPRRRRCSNPERNRGRNSRNHDLEAIVKHTRVHELWPQGMADRAESPGFT